MNPDKAAREGNPRDTQEPDQRLFGVLDGYWQALEQDQAADAEPWLRAHPDGREGLGSLRVLAAMHAAAQVLDADSQAGPEPATSGGGDTETAEPAAEPDPVFGTLPHAFGRYQLLRRLGGGGMGTVYLAHDTTLDRKVALKISRFEPDKHPQAMERFLREARAAAGIQHEAVCPVFDYGAIDGVPYITMAYIPGKPLRALLGGPPLEQRWVAGLVRRVAQGLEAAHRQGVIHRDLKPDNIVLDEHDQPRVVDFGLAWRAQDPALTQPGATPGTPAYMSPEQIRGKELGPATDIYSLGVVLYQLLTGRLPFGGQDTAQLAYRIVHTVPRPPSRHRPGLDPALDQVCLKALAKEVGRRPASMAQFANALEPVMRSTEMHSRRLSKTKSAPPASPDSPGSDNSSEPCGSVKVRTVSDRASNRPKSTGKRRRPVHLRATVAVRRRTKDGKTLVGCSLSVAAAVIALLAAGSVYWIINATEGKQELARYREVARNGPLPNNGPPPNAGGSMAPRMGPDMGAQLRPMPGGSINVRVRKKDAVGRRELSVKDPGALPLQAGDELRIEVLLNRPAYPYVVWINATGKAVPVYPWQSGQWDKRPASEQPVERLSLPGKADGGLTVKAGPAGMETLVLLVRAEPLPRDIDLGQVLAGLPPQRLQNGHAVVWFENGGVVRGDPARAPKSFEPDQPGDPVLETQRAISESLKGFYPYTSAVSMAKRGGT